MSYNIAVVNFRLPSDFKLACDLVAPLVEAEVPTVEPVFLEFHRRITAKFPCICELQGDEIDDGVWCDGPLIDNFLVKAPVIGFVYSKVNDALPIVGNIALEMGLSVLDWQSHTVYNP